MEQTVTRATLRFVPVPPAIAEAARRTRTDAFGHHLEPVVDDSTNPCRSCLRYVKAGTPLLLLSYRPMEDRNPYAETGPIFVCADDCTPYADTHEFPPDFLTRPLTIRAYDREGRIAGADVAAPGQAHDVARRFLEDERVTEVHARNPAWGCYDFKIVAGK